MICCIATIDDSRSVLMPVAKGATAKLPAPRVRESFVPSMTSGDSVSMISGKIPTRLEEFVPEIPRFKVSSLGVFASSAHNASSRFGYASAGHQADGKAKHQ